MVFHHIRKINNPHHRRAVYGILSLHGIFVALVAIKTVIFNIAALKAFVYGSVFLMGLFDLVPHVTFASDINTPIDYSLSNTYVPIYTNKGQAIVYGITYKNESDSNGGTYSPGSNVVITANIPQGMSYASHEGMPYTSITPTQIVWNVPSDRTDMGIIILTLMVSPSAPASVTSIVSLTHANPDPFPDNNNGSLACKSCRALTFTNGEGIIADVDLAITKTVNNTTPNMFDDVIFTITYRNDGSETAIDTKIYDIIPNGLYPIDMAISPKPDSTADNLYVRNVGDVPPGGQGVITLRTSILPDQHSEIINTAIITSKVVEQSIENNTAEIQVIPTDGEPNMYIDIFPEDADYAENKTICIGDTITFTVDFGNQGFATANQVSVRLNKPSTFNDMTSLTPSTLLSPGVYSWAFAENFYTADSRAFTFDLKGYQPGTNQAVPVSVYSDNQLIASDEFDITILPTHLCGGSEEEEEDDDEYVPPVYGCTIVGARNYNSQATINNGSCDFTEDFVPKYGCIYTSAINYDATATHNNGSCLYTTTKIKGCMDNKATNYNASATEPGTCTFAPAVTTGTGSGTGTNNTGAIVSSGSGTGTGNTGMLVLPLPTITVAPPSKINFFVTKPTPKKSEIKKAVKELKEAVATPATVVKKVIKDSDIPTSCNSRMPDIYKYAVAKKLITDEDVENLCKPFAREKMAQIVVDFVINSAFIEPSLSNKCIYKDVKSNVSRFYAEIMCDLRLAGSKNTGDQKFRPTENVTRAEFAVVVSNYLFGDTLPDAKAGEYRYTNAMRELDRAFLMKNINPEKELYLGQALEILRRIDLGNVAIGTRYIKLRDRSDK